MDKEQQRKNKLWRAHYKLNGPALVRTEKTCARCGQLKPIESFPINRDRPDWHANNCKPCNVAIKQEWRERNPEKARAASLRQAARSREKPEDQRLKYSRKYYRANKAKAHKRSMEWRNRNRQQYAAIQRRCIKQRLQSDPSFAFGFRFRAKIRLLLSGLRKSAPTEQLLGCSIAEFRKHLESLWEPWMSWDNYGGKDGQWCIDHIMPVAAFDLSKPEEQKCCFHYSNLRPLCVKKNREKWHRYDAEELAKLRGLHSVKP